MLYRIGWTWPPAVAVGCAAVVVISGLSTTPAEAASHPLPAPDASIPREPALLAHTLLVATRSLDEAIDRWREDGNPSAGTPPRDVELLALYHQRIYRLLRRDDALARAVVRLLPSGLAPEARSIVASGKALRRITPPLKAPTIRTKGPLPIGVLLRQYTTPNAASTFDGNCSRL
jgi:hypothetical protein